MSKGKIHVVPYGDAWAVKREGADRASKITSTKGEAMKEARKLALNNNENIVVHGRKGQVTQGKYTPRDTEDDSCFITTACVHHFNLNEDCYQLSTLRTFRDNYLSNTTEGKQLINQYYILAPQIVNILNRHPQKNILYQNIFSKINSACALIERGKLNQAKDIYMKMVSYLLKHLHPKYGC